MYEEIERDAILKGAAEPSIHTYFMKTIVNLLLPSFQMTLKDQQKKIEQLENKIKQLEQNSAASAIAGVKIDEQESPKKKKQIPQPQSFSPLASAQPTSTATLESATAAAKK